MPVRFRRTFTIFPGVKVNVSKGGISFTVGTKGYHLNFSNRGVKQTVGLPGTGVSHSTYLFDNDEDEEDNREENDIDGPKRKRTARQKKNTDSTPDTDQSVVSESGATRRRTPAWIILVGIFVIYLGALVLGLIPANFLSQLLHTLLDWTQSIGL